MEISEVLKLDGRLLHIFFDLKTLRRLIDSIALFIKVRLHLCLGNNFS